MAAAPNNNRSNRSRRFHKTAFVCAIESVEQRLLFINTIQVNIPSNIVALQARDLQNLSVNMSFKDVVASVRMTG